MNYLHVLTLIFIGLKVSNVIAWSWWLVVAPSLVSIVVGLFLVIWFFWIATK